MTSAESPHVAHYPLNPMQSGLFSQPTLVIAREVELDALQHRLDTACAGHRQFVCITGEPGIGKTTVVDAFLARLAAYKDLRIISGQCIEHYNRSEAYRPILEILGRLCRAAGEPVVTLLRQHAPTWLMQMPGFLPEAEYEKLQRRIFEISPARRLQELVEAIEILTAQTPLVVVLEDLHWSDYATLDLLALLARRREPARLLVLGTYRPIDAMQAAHPVHTMMQELQRYGLGVELRLDYLSEAGVMSYLARRFVGMPLPDGLASLLWQRTNGNPLFLSTLVDDIVRRGLLHLQAGRWMLTGELANVMIGMPESLRHLIERQLDRISPNEQKILEAASVIGKEFSAATLAASVDQPLEEVEALCTAWNRRGQFVHTCGTKTLPDGTVVEQYRFIHDLYRETLFDRVPVSRRARIHRQLGMWLEASSSIHSREMVPELVGHFMQGRNTGRVVHYLQSAGEQTLRRNTSPEALTRLNPALQLLKILPDAPGRTSLVADPIPLRSPGASSETSLSISQATFRQEGEYWTLAFQGAVCRVKDVRGMHYLAQLLRYPHHAFSALALVRDHLGNSRDGKDGVTLPQTGDQQVAQDSSLETVFIGTDDVLDPQARAAYKRRLEELRSELDQGHACHNLEQVAMVQAEIDFLTQELARTVSLGGRSRKIVSPAERARVNVTRAIRTAISRITASHAELGKYLSRTIKTGYHCIYTPLPHDSLPWRF